MKKIINYIFVLAMLLGFAACQPSSYRKVYPSETPTLNGTLAEQSIVYGQDSITLNVSVGAKQTPLSTLTVKIIVGQTMIKQEVLRTKDMNYSSTLRYAVPFVAGLEEGAEVQAFLTAENVEGDKAQLIVGGCFGHRPAIESMFVMPPTIEYTVLGKGKQMTMENGTYVAYGLGYPKSIKCLFATVGTKFGRIDWSKPVFGMIDGEMSVITEEQFNAGIASAVTLANDNLESIDTIRFNPLTFEYSFGGKVLSPVSKVDINTDLEENPTYMSSSAAKKYRGAKIFFDKDSEVEITGCADLSKAYNLDFMEYLGGNKVKFLGDKAMYYVSYNIAGDYLVVEPLYNLSKPDVMYLCGVGMGQPTNAPEATSGWGFDSPDQNFVGRAIEPNVYQFTVYMKNDSENADHPGFGSVNFKFFHQHGWGGEETALDYTQDCCAGMKINSSNEESNVGNWWSASDPLFEGVYRITLDMNKNVTKYEKVR